MVSVVVPVKNAGSDLPELLRRMAAQQGFRRVEQVVVDSGSTDGSAEAAEAAGATLIRIASEEFSHSHARNLGAERASGDYVLFTVQDALPSSERWLSEMFDGLRRHQAAAVSCGESPRADSDLFYRVISWNHHRFMSADGSDRLMTRPAGEDPLERRRNAQISDTACLIGRPLFLDYRHRGNYAEDLDLGLRLMDDGYRLAFLAGVHILHSHNRPAYYHLRRSYVEHLALLDMLPGHPTVPGNATAAVRDIVSSCADIDHLVRDELSDLSLPCPPRALLDAVTRARRSPGPPTAAPDAGDHLDGRTRQLVKRLQARPAADALADPAQGSLSQSVGSIAGTICDYAEHGGLMLDAAAITEFKAALYKGWALHCGVRLASAYWRGPRDARDSLRDLHEELTSEV